jgi:hypothetical protein
MIYARKGTMKKLLLLAASVSCGGIALFFAVPAAASGLLDDGGPVFHQVSSRADRMEKADRVAPKQIKGGPSTPHLNLTQKNKKTCCYCKKSTYTGCAYLCRVACVVRRGCEII